MLSSLFCTLERTTGRTSQELEGGGTLLGLAGLLGVSNIWENLVLERFQSGKLCSGSGTVGMHFLRDLRFAGGSGVLHQAAPKLSFSPLLDLVKLQSVRAGAATTASPCSGLANLQSCDVITYPSIVM